MMVGMSRSGEGDAVFPFEIDGGSHLTVYPDAVDHLLAKETRGAAVVELEGWRTSRSVLRSPAKSKCFVTQLVTQALSRASSLSL